MEKKRDTVTLWSRFDRRELFSSANDEREQKCLKEYERALALSSEVARL